MAFCASRQSVLAFPSVLGRVARRCRHFSPRTCASMSSSQPPLQAALIDLNGTLHVGDSEIPGSVAALRRLREAGVACRFVTNTTKVR